MELGSTGVLEAATSQRLRQVRLAYLEVELCRVEGRGWGVWVVPLIHGVLMLLLPEVPEDLSGQEVGLCFS